ncbi:hypothetical protein QZQ06_19610 [Serratia marcescens]|uniref:hypothetical protein n=1 Tax=Serratia marcescens TaxID=615 RepID=UPI0006CB37A5|nr:hypothetical protein [Serratia marcescens]ALE97501.1 hypothetical protein ABH11_03200 [Serratia marcescens]MBH3229695.1 hypothetical protein [Serratia marcescens]MDP8651917.1 hypothetical protein [Serratia marcescens]MDP8666769.1 hypothetical protein [Serratia marcescens]MDP8741954.1 hypothetical protein [Serratia marcescens]
MSHFKFAHLLGLKKKASEEEDDDKEKSKKAKSRRAEERDDEEDAEDDDDREDMEDDDDREPDAEDDDDDKEKGKKAKSRRAEEDDEDAEEDENRDVKKGRRAERKRCAAIFGSKHAAGRPDMAAHLAFNTRMSAREAIDTLATVGAVAPQPQGRKSLDARMRESEQARLGPDGEKPATGKNALVSKMTSLYDTARGNK